jgi:phosphoserine aminotransferase
MSKNIYNFSAGPATLPKSVVDQVKLNINNFDQGLSILEVSHRSNAFKDFASESESTFRRLLNISDEYEVLFLQGGATHQFTMIPQNFSINGPLDYLITGGWSKKAAKYAQQQIEVNIVSDSSDINYIDVEEQDSWNINVDSDYFYYCANETVHGVEIHNPITTETPLICDMSSTLCTRPIDVSGFDLIFAGAQKNLGIAGLTIVIVKKEFIKQKAEHLNPIMRYEDHAKDKSMLNTSPVFAWYAAGQVFDWIEEQGGLEVMAQINQTKSQLLYEYIDNSELYQNPVSEKYRSWVNIPFILKDNTLDSLFISQAEKSGLYNLKGHRTVGGMRASVYNAMPVEGVKTLISFMKDFEISNRT